MVGLMGTTVAKKYKFIVINTKNCSVIGYIWSLFPFGQSNRAITMCSWPFSSLARH